MTMDLSALVDRDHHDLDRVLATMGDPHTARDSLRDLLEALWIGTSAHARADAAVLFALRLHAPRHPLVEALGARTLADHLAHRRALAALAETPPGGQAWFTRVLELRIATLEHAARTALIRTALLEQLSAAASRGLAREYVTERLQCMANADLSAATVAVRGAAAP